MSGTSSLPAEGSARPRAGSRRYGPSEAGNGSSAATATESQHRAGAPAGWRPTSFGIFCVTLSGFVAAVRHCRCCPGSSVARCAPSSRARVSRRAWLAPATDETEASQPAASTSPQGTGRSSTSPISPPARLCAKRVVRGATTCVALLSRCFMGRPGTGVLDSTGPWSPKPARIYADPPVRRQWRHRQKPHLHGVSGGSSRLFRLAENRRVGSSILPLAIDAAGEAISGQMQSLLCLGEVPPRPRGQRPRNGARGPCGLWAARSLDAGRRDPEMIPAQEPRRQAVSSSASNRASQLARQA